jgi:hypothetical protein
MPLEETAVLISTLLFSSPPFPRTIARNPSSFEEVRVTLLSLPHLETPPRSSLDPARLQPLHACLCLYFPNWKMLVRIADRSAPARE